MIIGWVIILVSSIIFCILSGKDGEWEWFLISLYVVIVSSMSLYQIIVSAIMQ